MFTATLLITVTGTPSITQGTPTLYMIHGNAFVMDAVQSGDLLLDYLAKPAKLTAESENIAIPDEDMECVVLYMLQRVLGKLQDWNGVVEMKRQYGDAILQTSPIRQSQELEALWESGGGYD